MKLLNVLFLGLTLSFLVSCGGEPIVKTWKLENIDFEELLKEMPAETRDMMKKSADENMAKTKGKVIFDFKKDGSFTSENPGMDGTTSKETGKWSLSKDKKTLTAEIKGEKQDFVVHELSSSKLSIEPKGQKMKLIFVPK